MSTTAVMESPSTAAPTPSPEELAARLADAPFVRVVVAPTGGALAASGVIARALRERTVPFQVRVRRASAYTVDDDALTLRIGSAGPADLTLGDPARTPAVAFEVARALETAADPYLALAGIAAGEADPAASTLADRAGLERSPGVGLPVTDLADGLGHTTLLHGPVSGGADAAGATLAEWNLPAELDADARRKFASLVAVETTTAPGATPRAAESIARALNPLHLGEDAPFATVEGYGDVLSAVAREDPGTGVALALGHDARTGALEAWRTHANHVHTTLREAETARYGGVFVVRVASAEASADGTDAAERRRAAGRLRTVARLARDFRSPEPTVLVVSEGVAAAATHDDAVDVTSALTTALGPDETGTADGTAREADARFDGPPESFETAAREALS
ncbi:exonuclease RecJ [Salinigranum halophilum]|uniref:exonuclease RecJ n=1 Tax=Salinigranum halophilum TaxID=2565931 RepID=UPI0010A7EFA6|nr:exonuclease RecJ [Salinigranum halophilum]